MEKKVAYQKLDAYVEKHKLKNTRQRKEILDALLGLKNKHVTIDDLFDACKTQHPHIGYATVYRTLKLLTEAGIVEKRDFTGGRSQFEFESSDHHDHLICTQCSRIIEFENPKIETLQNQVAKSFDFELTHHKLQLYGICHGFKKSGVCSYNQKETSKK